jgi:guanylate kinase
MIKNNAFVEHATVFDNHYGSSTKLISEKLDEGVDVILEIDWQGARQVKENMPNSVSIFILPPSNEALLGRLKQRAQDDEITINKRMSDAQNQMQHFNEFDYLVINDDFNSALNDLNLIICRPGKASERFSLSLSEQSKKYIKLLKKLI